MIRLARHIEILLLGNECVIVPNLGGFVEHHVCARYDREEGLFLPPLRTLGFNPLLKMNDSLLAQSYVEAYDLSYPEAVSTIEDEVREVLRIMGTTGSYEFSNLGRLYYDKDGRMNFEPYESGILTPEFYALSSFEMPMLTKIETKDTASSDVTNPDDSEDEHAKVIYIGNEHGQRTLNISLKAIRNISVAAVVLATIFLVSFPLAKNQGGFSTSNIESGFYEMFFPHKDASKPSTPSTIKMQEAKQTVKQSAPAQAEKPIKTEPETTPVPSESHWCIVVCSHVTKANADVLAAKLKASGYNDITVSTTGATKVLYGNFATKAEAHSKLNELSGTEMFRDAWLLEVKK